MTRKNALTVLRIAGYHEDMRTFTRVYVENRVSLQVARREYAAGQQAKANGIACHCHECCANSGQTLKGGC